MSNWEEAQAWEADWWGNCLNTYGEEHKQLVYARKMGLELSPTPKTRYSFDLKGISVLDIGGGPVSLLLKCRNRGKCIVVDPLPIPEWAILRYEAADIVFSPLPAEVLDEKDFDEVWIYNVLEHTQDPRKIIQNAKRAGKLIRVFQWLDTHIVPGHIHTITEEQMNEWLGGEGRVEVLNQNECRGKAYYGVF